jgi:hypothetical protein
VEKFILKMKNAKRLNSSTLEIKESLYGENIINILSYKN